VTKAQRYLTFAAAILVTGVVSGFAGGFTTVVVKAIEHLAYGYEQGPLLAGVQHASIPRRLLGPAIGCTLAGLGWWLLRARATVPNLTNQIRSGRPFEHGPMGIDALLQVLAVGSGASLGREQAPRLFAASFTELWIRYGSIPPRYRQILLASAAGAGLAAVYNVPAAGVLFALGIILRSWQPVAVLVAVATSCIATVTVWPLTHGAPTFVWPETHFTQKAFIFAFTVMPLAVIIGTTFNGLMAIAKTKAPATSWMIIPSIGLAGLATGTASIWMPQMPGNGRSIVLESLSGGDTLIGVAIVVLLKPTLTALFLRAGAVGGMLTPALSTGVAMGAFVALAVQHMGGQASVPTLALIGGAAVLGITQNAPVFAAIFTAELTHPPLEVWLFLLFAAVGAHVLRIAITRRRAGHKVPAEH
jgi:H+/Cl- antiporter ClcA